MEKNNIQYLSQRKCPYCESPFLPKRKDQIYCRKKCCDKASSKRTGGWKRHARRVKWKRQGIDITYSQYETMFEKQGGICPICLEKFSSLVVDHNHNRGNIRGLLCHSCNLGIGSFRDNKENLERAIHYLELSQ